MKLTLLFTLALTPLAAFAGSNESKGKVPLDPESTISYYSLVDSTYTGAADFERGGHGSAWENSLQFGLSKTLPGLGWPNHKDGQWRLRLGAEWDRYDFDNDTALPIPNTLQSIAGVVALEYLVGGQAAIVLEAKPGVYFEQEITSGAFNVPIKLGAGYEINDTFSVVAGVSYNAMRSYQFIPVVGFVWKITPTLVVKAVAPDPRIEWQVTDYASIWLGGELAGNAFRADGGRKGELNHALVSYSDYRASLGTTWKPNERMTVEASGGVSFQRKFDYHLAEQGYRTDEAAPFVKLSLNTSF